MSNTRFKLFAEPSPEELEAKVNQFLSQDSVEMKQLDFATNGYEKPYNVAILYHENDNLPKSF